MDGRHFRLSTLLVINIGPRGHDRVHRPLGAERFGAVVRDRRPEPIGWLCVGSLRADGVVRQTAEITNLVAADRDETIWSEQQMDGGVSRDNGDRVTACGFQSVTLCTRVMQENVRRACVCERLSVILYLRIACGSWVSECVRV
jgi:hypothetical protein